MELHLRAEMQLAGECCNIESTLIVLSRLLDKNDYRNLMRRKIIDECKPPFAVDIIGCTPAF